MPTQPYYVDYDASEIDPQLLSVFKFSGKKNKIRVPGTTTIIGRFKDSSALMPWANRMGLEGLTLSEATKTALDAGTLCHLMVERDIRGLPELNLSEHTESIDVKDKASSAYLGYLEWKSQSHMKPLLTEIPIVSRKWLFGGTIDAVQINGKVALLDWKTSNGLYSDHLYQLGGGYSLLWKEAHPEQPIAGGYCLLRFSKIEGDFHHHAWQNLSMAERGFKYMRILYELDKRVKERL